ncbi:type II toxin-antitoxin system VapC family toxin [Mucilaginibacter sp.]|uniref:type II toxin-antitoxin system VapC family toxin n=1 Tax=Mucilaginibacter sp. TaxID=1882438 RepID=UPI00284F7EFF|nr:type II toxin-antitoxin system VapC family toxin [Mucilaginibacter sp.]MDR3693415.1 type II toxin-antitoxin system VapC family toxin [Mucilaginibacter sp.]
MNILLDTHIFIWFINGDKSLSEKMIAKIKNVENQCFFSIASIWEIAIKMKLNKLQLKSDFNEITKICIENDIEILPITFDHIQELNKLDLFHNDPFDRLIIAQGISEKLTVLTKDENFKLYKVKLIF